MNVLEKIVFLEKDADKLGFHWDNTDQIMAQIQSECLEVQAHLQDGITSSNRGLLEEEIGDLMHAVLSLGQFCNLDLMITLQKTATKFERRMNSIKDLMKERGLNNLIGLSFQERMDFWNEAKERCSHNNPSQNHDAIQ